MHGHNYCLCVTHENIFGRLQTKQHNSLGIGGSRLQTSERPNQQNVVPCSSCVCLLTLQDIGVRYIGVAHLQVEIRYNTYPLPRELSVPHSILSIVVILPNTRVQLIFIIKIMQDIALCDLITFYFAEYNIFFLKAAYSKIDRTRPQFPTINRFCY